MKKYAKILDFVGCAVLPLVLVFSLLFALIAGPVPALRSYSLAALWLGVLSFLLIWPVIFWAEKLENKNR